MGNVRIKAGTALAIAVFSLLAVSCGSGSTTTEQAGGPNDSGIRKGALGRAAADVPDDETTTTPPGESSTTTAPESTTTTTAPPPSSAPVTPPPTPPRITQPPVTQPPVSQAPVTLPPSGPADPTPTVQAKVTPPAQGPNCGTGKVSLTWASNVSSVQLTSTNGTTATLGGSGTQEFPFSCPGSATYFFKVSNGSGSANAQVTAQGS